MRTSATSAIHVAVFVSITVHAAVLLELGSRYTPSADTNHKTKAYPVQRVVISAYTSPPAPSRQPAKATITSSDTGPGELPPAKPVAHTTQVSKVPVKPSRPVPASPAPATPEAKLPTAESPPQRPVPMPLQQAIAATPLAIDALREDYIHKVLSRIEQHKAYPPLARRRRISGDVVLALRIDGAGKLQAVQCVRGHPLLCRAATEATHAAQPLPTLPQGVQRLAFDYKMAFHLR